jgi:hypothetical protein
MDGVPAILSSRFLPLDRVRPAEYQKPLQHRPIAVITSEWFNYCVIAKFTALIVKLTLLWKNKRNHLATSFATFEERI